MLITSLLPLLSRYSLGFDLVAGPDGTVTLTILPRKAHGSSRNPGNDEIRPISITATASEIDAELARGTEGALGQLIVARKTLAEQLAEQQRSTEAAKAKVKPAKAASTPAPAASSPQSEPQSNLKPGEPASLW